MTGNTVYLTASLWLRFSLEALSLDLLPPSLARQVARLTPTSSPREINSLLLALPAQLAVPSSLPHHQPTDSLPNDLLSQVFDFGPPAAENRSAAERLGRFCQLLLGDKQNRRATGSFYTPAAVADNIVQHVLQALLSSRNLPLSQLSSLRLLDPAVGAGAFLLAALDAAADLAGEPPQENDFRRQMIQHLWGLETNPLALQCCLLALWLYASRPGRAASLPESNFQLSDALAPLYRPRSFDLVFGNPPWGLPLTGDNAVRLRREAGAALKGHDDSFLYFLYLASTLARDDGAIALLLPDAILWQVRYRAMRNYLLKRFRPLRISLLGERLFGDATAPACALCLLGKDRAPKHYSVVDIRPSRNRPPRHWEAERDSPCDAFHNSFLAPPSAITALLRRLLANYPALGRLDNFAFHDVGLNYPRAQIGRAAIYTGAQQHPDDLPIVRGRDFHALTTVSHSAWLRHDWAQRAPQLAVRENVYRLFPKLFIRQTGDRPTVTLDRIGRTFGRSVIALTGPMERDLLGLAGLMNSTPFAALYRALVPEGGRTFAQVKVTALRALPISYPLDERLANLAAAALERPAHRLQLLADLDVVAAQAYNLADKDIAELYRSAVITPWSAKPPNPPVDT